MNPADILRNAAAYIQKHGWIQGALDNDEGEVCALGAICAVTDRLLRSQPDYCWEEVEGLVRTARFALQLHIGCDLNHFGIGIPSWNDDPHTTAEDVILAMKHAAADYESQEAL